MEKEMLELMDELVARLAQVNQDALVLAARLMAEDEDLFSPEVQEVMSRWRGKVDEALGGPPHDVA